MSPRHPFWQVGFRPFFTLACLAGLSLPAVWALIVTGAVPPAPTFQGGPLLWHAHEMFYGFGLAMLGGFLLTASKNWVAIRGYHGRSLQWLFAAWLLDRVLMLFGGGLPRELVLAGGSLFTGALVAMLLATLIRHRRTDSYPDNFYFILALPLLLPAKWLLLTDGQFSAGVAMSLAIFRLAFLIMLERTLVQFMRNVLQISLPRHAALDHSIKTLALGMVFAPWLPTALHATVASVLTLLLAVRWLLWRPLPALRRIDIGIMVLGHLAIVVQMSLETLALWQPMAWVGSVPVHVFTLGTMGLIVPAMIVRISRGHTGRPVVFDARDRLVLWLAIAALLVRVGLPQLAAEAYPAWILLSAALWLAIFGLLSLRYLPWLLQARADGREH